MKLLIVDDDPAFNKMLSNYLLRNKFEVESAHSAQSALTLIASNTFDLVLTDYKLPKMNGLELIATIKKKTPQLPVILITNYSDIRTAVQSIKLGAYEFVNKPVIPDELLKTIHRAIEQAKAPSKPEIQAKEKAALTSKYIIGKSAKSQELWKHINIVAPTKMSVLIMGESGTGKEYVARKIHELSKRSKQAFIAIDCGVLSKDLASSELFGHKKGAFTGAHSDRKGQFELANGGTLFLDEIGNLPYDVQTQLLRALQEKTIRKVGDDVELTVDVRIIAATNEILSDNIENDSFRNDLFHRLNEFELYVPPLREKINDIDEYVDFFIAEACKELDKKSRTLSPEVKEIFRNYEWPGNLRELKNIIKRSVLLSESDFITTQHLPNDLIHKNNNVEPSKAINHKPDLNLKGIQEKQEIEAITEALTQHKFNKSKAAKALNIDRSTLYKKIKAYNIDA